MGFWSDVGNAVTSAGSAIGDLVEDGVGAVVDTVEDSVDSVFDFAQDSIIRGGTEWLCKNAGSVLCGIGNVAGGIVGGLLKGSRDLINDAADIIRDIGGTLGSIFRLDLPGLLRNIGKFIVNSLDLAVDAIRFFSGGYVIGGIIKRFKRSSLINFVDQLVNDQFESDSEIRDTVKEKI